MFDMIEKFMRYIMVAIFIMSMTSSTVVYYSIKTFNFSYVHIFLVTLVINLLTFIVFLTIVSD